MGERENSRQWQMAVQNPERKAEHNKFDGSGELIWLQNRVEEMRESEMGEDCVRDVSWGQIKKAFVNVANECVIYVNVMVNQLMTFQLESDSI